MTKNFLTIEDWRRLYGLAAQVKDMQPWEWMEESDIFGVQDPESDEIGFVSVMGMAGEHYAIAVYRGPTGLYGFWDLQRLNPTEAPERLLEIPQLMLSFEDRNFLRQEDYEIIRQLGLKFRGAHAWPMFRSIHPGYFPWFLTPEEARFMVCVLEQAIDVTLRFKTDKTLREEPDEDYLVRIPHKDDGRLSWENRKIHVPPPGPLAVSISLDMNEVKTLRRLTRSSHIIEIDLFMIPAPVGEKGDRPFCPYNLMLVETKGNLILGNESLLAEPSLEAMWGSIPSKIVHLFTQAGIIPREVKVRSELLFQLLKPLAEEFHFELTHTRTLKKLDSAKKSILQFLSREEFLS
ncbi:MAG: DUF6930 domain-containing protein [bacterium]